MAKVDDLSVSTLEGTVTSCAAAKIFKTNQFDLVIQRYVGPLTESRDVRKVVVGGHNLTQFTTAIVTAVDLSDPATAFLWLLTDRPGFPQELIDSGVLVEVKEEAAAG